MFSLQTDFLKHRFHLPAIVAFMASLFLIHVTNSRCVDVRKVQERRRENKLSGSVIFDLIFGLSVASSHGGETTVPV